MVRWKSAVLCACAIERRDRVLLRSLGTDKDTNQLDRMVVLTMVVLPSPPAREPTSLFLPTEAIDVGKGEKTVFLFQVFRKEKKTIAVRMATDDESAAVYNTNTRK